MGNMLETYSPEQRSKAISQLARKAKLEEARIEVLYRRFMELVREPRHPLYKGRYKDALRLTKMVDTLWADRFWTIFDDKAHGCEFKEFCIAVGKISNADLDEKAKIFFGLMETEKKKGVTLDGFRAFMQSLVKSGIEYGRAWVEENTSKVSGVLESSSVNLKVTYGENTLSQDQRADTKQPIGAYNELTFTTVQQVIDAMCEEVFTQADANKKGKVTEKEWRKYVAANPTSVDALDFYLAVLLNENPNPPAPSDG